jgi:hypothetical protein
MNTFTPSETIANPESLPKIENEHGRNFESIKIANPKLSEKRPHLNTIAFFYIHKSFILK